MCTPALNIYTHTSHMLGRLSELFWKAQNSQMRAFPTLFNDLNFTNCLLQWGVTLKVSDRKQVHVLLYH